MSMAAKTRPFWVIVVWGVVVVLALSALDKALDPKPAAPAQQEVPAGGSGNGLGLDETGGR